MRSLVRIQSLRFRLILEVMSVISKMYRSIERNTQTRKYYDIAKLTNAVTQ